MKFQAQIPTLVEILLFLYIIACQVYSIILRQRIFPWACHMWIQKQPKLTGIEKNFTANQNFDEHHSFITHPPWSVEVDSPHTSCSIIQSFTFAHLGTRLEDPETNLQCITEWNETSVPIWACFKSHHENQVSMTLRWRRPSHCPCDAK